MKTATFKPSIRKNDLVQVIAGREKGKSGKVISVFAGTSRILVEKVNMVKRHVKPTQQTPQGGISEKESSLPYSNVLLFCPKCSKGVRHGHKFMDVAAKGKKTKTSSTGSQRKVRYCKKCDGVLDTI